MTPNLSALVRQQSIAEHLSDVVSSYEKSVLPRKASGKCDVRQLLENRIDHKGLHVPIVDDNDINLKVRRKSVAEGLPRLTDFRS